MTLKRALCIGINAYPGLGADLGGAVNDAREWREILIQRGFHVDLLLERDATRSRMLSSIRALAAAMAAGDTAVMTFSGHGTWLPDQDGDEADGRDEALCPHDVASVGPIVDDELGVLFRVRHDDSRLFVVVDACHSGTVARMLPTWTPAPGLLGVRAVRGVPPPELVRAGLCRPPPLVSATSPDRGLRADALLFAACGDSQLSYECVMDGRRRGVFTYHAIQTLKELPACATYRDWLRAVRRVLPNSDFPQTPQLTGTRTQLRWRIFS